MDANGRESCERFLASEPLIFTHRPRAMRSARLKLLLRPLGNRCYPRRPTGYVYSCLFASIRGQEAVHDKLPSTSPSTGSGRARIDSDTPTDANGLRRPKGSGMGGRGMGRTNGDS